MGIFIHLNISNTIKAEEWERAYEKSLELVKRMPFMEKKEKECYGAKLICATKTVEKERYGRLGWHTIGDSISLKWAENYFLPRNILERKEPDASGKEYIDPYMSILPAYSDFSFEDERCDKVIELWGNKTQAEPYHFYLLAVACMLEQELPGKVAIYGDITRGQCKRAAQIASDLLGEEIELPDRCDLQRLYRRVREMPLQEGEVVNSFLALHLGKQEEEFGEFIRKNFSSEELQAYWESVFEYSNIATYGFSDRLKKYLLWGFSVADLNKYVQFHDEEGNSLEEKFVKAVLDTEVFLEEKDCEDVLEIDQEKEGSYSIYTLLAQFMFAGAKNHRVNRYIPLEDLIKELTECVGDDCDISRIVAEYMEERERNNTEDNPTDMLNTHIHKMCDKEMTSREKYDITDAEQLMWFENGKTIDESLNKWILGSFAFYRTTLEEENYKKLLQEGSSKAIRFLIEQNRSLLFMEESWEEIFHEIEENITTLERYYPMVRMELSTDDQLQLIQAFVLNDEFYEYCMKQLDHQGSDVV